MSRIHSGDPKPTLPEVALVVMGALLRQVKKMEENKNPLEGSQTFQIPIPFRFSELLVSPESAGVEDIGIQSSERLKKMIGACFRISGIEGFDITIKSPNGSEIQKFNAEIRFNNLASVVSFLRNMTQSVDPSSFDPINKNFFEPFYRNMSRIAQALQKTEPDFTPLRAFSRLLFPEPSGRGSSATHSPRNSLLSGRYGHHYEFPKPPSLDDDTESLSDPHAIVREREQMHPEAPSKAPSIAEPSGEDDSDLEEERTHFTFQPEGEEEDDNPFPAPHETPVPTAETIIISLLPPLPGRDQLNVGQRTDYQRGFSFLKLARDMIGLFPKNFGLDPTVTDGSILDLTRDEIGGTVTVQVALNKHNGAPRGEWRDAFRMLFDLHHALNRSSSQNRSFVDRASMEEDLALVDAVLKRQEVRSVQLT